MSGTGLRLHLLNAAPVLFKRRNLFVDAGVGSRFAPRLGLACDHLVEVELVTASEEVVRVNENEHAELFWARNVRRDLAPWASGDVYLNFIGDEGQDRVVARCGAANYEHLAQLKAAYDPDNLFRLNHNMKPAVAT